jgi:ABC-type transport system substrate-binding protein
MQRYISMNVTQKPFDNPKVREAINYAINRQALVKSPLRAMPPGDRRGAAVNCLC